MRPSGGLAEALAKGLGAGSSPLPVGARVERDLAYGTDPAQCLDVYRPAGRPGGAIIVVVHGGGWTIGDKANPAVVAGKVAHWLPAGMVVASVNYRMLPLADPLQQAGDVARAIAFVQAHAAGWQADPGRLVVIGHSSGAHLAALLAADPALAQCEGAAPWRATVLLDSAALDVVEIMSRPHLPLFDRAFGSSEPDWPALSPLHRLRARPTPMLLVHSNRRSDSAGAAQRFAAAVAAQGGRAEVHDVALSHAAVNAQLGLDDAYTQRVDAFLRSVGVP